MRHLDLNKLKRYSVAGRKSKVKKEEFSFSIKKGASFKNFYDSFPNLLAAKSFRSVVRNIISARKRKKPVILMMGAHVIKCGLSPVIIELMRRGIITAVAANGACIIHDFEIAYMGRTSEDVGCAITDGSFGMACETADCINSAVAEANNNDLGIGEGMGRFLDKGKFKFNSLSIFYNCKKFNIPATVHVSMGADIVHMHPSADGAAIGECSLRDFRKLAEEISGLEGGVLLNIGSAVMMPEVFLKALVIARNLGSKVNNFTTANFDMSYHYRPAQNIVNRPTSCGGEGYYIIGHHEIMLPLLCAAIIEGL